jgi:hypothetical protein
VARSRLLVLGIFLVLAVFRWLVVDSWHVPAGDGIEYFQLSQELSANHRYAHGPGEPLTYVRLPGYPLFLSYVAVREAPVSKETHLIRATRWNVALNLVTALLILAMLVELGQARAVGVAGGVIVLVCPIIFYLCCYGLTESLGTLLVTGELVAAIFFWKRGRYGYAAAAGVCAGLAQLVRVSSAMTLPSVVAALWLADLPVRKRLTAIVLCGACALLVFLPWPVRNLVRFGGPHPLGAEWEDVHGNPLPPGPPVWMRSWATGAPGESYFSFQLVTGRPPTLLPQMYDDDVEKAKLEKLFTEVSHKGITPEVDAMFLELAKERAHNHPFRTWVGLPFRRLVSLWKPMPEWELPMRTRWLGLPGLRRTYGWIGWALYLLGFAGAVIVWRRQRNLVPVLLGGLLLSSLMHMYLHAFPVERYLAPTLPPLLALAAVACAEALRVSRSLVRSRRA